MRLPLLFLTLVIFLAACQKPNDADQPDPPTVDTTANYTLAGAPGACSNAAISGQYKINASLQATNTVAIDVVVQTPGYFKIATDTVNGIWFRIDSSFTTTGAQRVVLKGFGIPTNSGTFLFKMIAKQSTCSFSLTVDTLKRYVDKVSCPSCSNNWGFIYNANNQISGIYPAYFWTGTSRTFLYDANGRVSAILNADTDKDSLVYNNQGKVSVIYNRVFYDRNGNYASSRIDRIDTLYYDGRGLLASRSSMGSEWDWSTNSYVFHPDSRYDFTFNADSNLTQVIYYRYENGVFKPHQRFTYGSYDTKPNPLKNVGGVNLYFPGILRYTTSNADHNNFSQLSKNNAGGFNFYVITSQGTWFLDLGRQMTYTYETDGQLKTGRNNVGETTINITYKFK